MMTVDNQGVLNKPVASSFIAPVVCCIGDGLPMLPSCGCLSAGVFHYALGYHDEPTLLFQHFARLQYGYHCNH